MRYVDAGYVVALVVLTLYAVSLVARRRRLLRAASLIRPDAGVILRPDVEVTAGPPGAPGATGDLAAEGGGGPGGSAAPADRTP